ncbi:phospholipase C [Intrasporangium oryzae NRRL B-24470]|uniref:phospholipase C n=1 Tax=Intrasporangium oryzae NRRL B-24470 TaxID=1386089 RepID=W9GCN2_9MICO|nr:alkaline phosphatase family protein [Intrasporangium oryzae]EWT02563.1 phospholipase C [Intrasporangium oryzae NRRL B-24470]
MSRSTRVAVAGGGVAALALAGAALTAGQAGALPEASATRTPIKHVVVIFGENISFDHYFATYPQAANVAGETLQGGSTPAPAFTAAPNTPRNIATLAHDDLLAPNNPNSVQPERLTPGQAVTCDQDHTYTNEQKAYNGGAMDQFVEHVSKDACKPGRFSRAGLTMDYFDGNTVTAMWNYAQKYAMSDNSYSTTFGPSSPGAINLVSGQTHGVQEYAAASVPEHPTQIIPASSDYTVRVPDANGVGTMTGDPDPVYDDCSNSSHTTSYTLAGMQPSNKNVGDLLGAKGVSWGWFQGGFAPTKPYDPATGAPAECKATHSNVAGITSTDYNPHHQPFQYYATTANPHHLAPASVAEIGHDGRANHQYDLSAFDQVVNTDQLPAVSFLKAANYQDGHADYSDPVDEQHFVVKEINAIEQSPNWKDTAIVLAYDDSDGWYDHRAATLTNASNSPDDAAWCRDAATRGVPVSGGYQDRCGPGPRQPLLVISPYARTNWVDHTQTDQTSILRFIEDNWNVGQIGDHSADAVAGPLDGLFHFPNAKAPEVLLDPLDGTVVSVDSVHGSSHN